MNIILQMKSTVLKSLTGEKSGYAKNQDMQKSRICEKPGHAKNPHNPLDSMQAATAQFLHRVSSIFSVPGPEGPTAV